MTRLFCGDNAKIKADKIGYPENDYADTNGVSSFIKIALRKKATVVRILFRKTGKIANRTQSTSAPAPFARTDMRLSFLCPATICKMHLYHTKQFYHIINHLSRGQQSILLIFNKICNLFIAKHLCLRFYKLARLSFFTLYNKKRPYRCPLTARQGKVVIYKKI